MDAIAAIVLLIVGVALLVVGISVNRRPGHRSDPEDALADAELMQEYDRHRTSAIEMEDRMNEPRNGGL